MKNLFNTIQIRKPKKNVFDLSHDVKLSLNMGELVPIMVTEAVPGDKFNISCESLLRFAPLVAPVMHRMDVSMHYFFVPNRITWPGWEDFITGNDTVSPPVVQIDSTNETRLTDYLGIPPAIGAEAEVISALPMAAYQMIYNEYYRDQNLIAEVDYELVNGSNTANTDLFVLRKRAWEHDYFTAALPFAQKGNAVAIPLGEVQLKADWAAGTPPYPNFESGTGVNYNGNIQTLIGGPGGGDYITNSANTFVQQAYNPEGSLEVGSTTVSDLRRAIKLQEFLELTARGGSRLIEWVRSVFGVKSSDARLQRPEYITGTKSPVQVSEVLNTSDTASAPQGNMAGHGISVTSGKYGNYFCEEHGFIIGIMSVMPKTAYQQGIQKHWLKQDRLEYFIPQFAHIGEQPVENRELYAFQGTDGDDTFGYVPRYAEYKFENNRVAGDFRTTLDHWQAGRIFSAPPALNEDFVSADPTHRIFAVTDPNEQKLYCHVYNKVRAIRPMPKFGTPFF